MLEPLPLTNRLLDVKVASGDALDVRHFQVRERMSALFEITLVAVSENADIDFEAVVGQAASFAVRGVDPRQDRRFTGVVSHLQQTGVEDRGLSTYQITIVPTLWLATQRRNHRMFQHLSELDIARRLLAEWEIRTTEKITSEYKKRKYRVQYGESDFAFLCRMLEDAGISFHFEAQDGESALVLHDAPQSSEARVPPLPYRENPMDGDVEHVTEVHVGRRVRPGKYTMRDHDYRRPASFKLGATAQGASGVEEKLERFHYVPGSLLFDADRGDPTPSADDKGRYRTSEPAGEGLAKRRLDAKRAVAKTISFSTNALDPAPGVVVSLLDHPKSEVGPGKRLLVLGSSLSGTHSGEWTHACEAVSAEIAYHPPLDTPKPKVVGVESATVVGPAGEEIHTDEFGRVRVHFHWDRESKMDDDSSCWIHVSQPWGGAGFGGTHLPRIGQEVIVDFLGGDPDRPIIVGRVFTNLQKTPYKLPDHKTQSGWRSRSSPGGGGDNYNELMFEDEKGRELLRMQAEKDLSKLVKNDEDATIGHDQTVSVGNDRTKTIGANELMAIGLNQVLTVGADQSTQIGNALRVNVGESIEIVCGKSVLKMDKSGHVTIHGTKFDFEATGHVQVTGDLIDLN